MDPRHQLLKRLDHAWQAFQNSYAGLSDSELLVPGVAGNWSVRDLIVHVTSWEQEALKHLPTVLAGNRPPRYSTTHGGINAFNALITRQRLHLSLPEVFALQADVHRQLVAFIDTLPDDKLNAKSRLRHRLRMDTYSHYPIHTAAILQWRRQRS